MEILILATPPAISDRSYERGADYGYVTAPFGAYNGMCVDG